MILGKGWILLLTFYLKVDVLGPLSTGWSPAHPPSHTPAFPSLAHPSSILVKLYEIFSFLFLLPDFFPFEIHKRPDQPEVCFKSEKKRTVCLKCENGKIKNCCFRYMKLLNMPTATLYFVEEAKSRPRKEKLLCLNKANEEMHITT